MLVILIALGVHSCQVSARNSSLRDYANNVSSLTQESNQTGKQLFQDLASGGGQANATSLQNQINQARVNAAAELSHARGIDIPDEVRAAQENFATALRMRLDGITNIAAEIQPALGTATSQDAVSSIAAQTARFYASDVLYKDYTATAIAAALHTAGIAVGGPNGVTIDAGQFLPNIEWLTPAFVATELSAPVASTSKTIAPGLHGHALNSVSVAGTTLQTGSNNTIPASPAPTFSLNFTNGGTNNETNVICKVSVTGTSTSGQTVVPETIAGKTSTCRVTVSSKPAAGTNTVVATIEPVAGEKNKSNNSLSFPVTFQ